MTTTLRPATGSPTPLDRPAYRVRDISLAEWGRKEIDLATLQEMSEAGAKVLNAQAVEWARRGAELGAGELLLNSMDADGTKAGFDLELIAAVRQVVAVPLIASGGAGAVAHFPPAVAAGADAVLAASVFHFGELTVGEVKDALRAAGQPVR